MLGALAARIRKKGFDGPYYRGLRGKLRFALESTVGRREIILMATPETFANAAVPGGPKLELHPVRKFADFEPFRRAFEAAYYPGYTEQWRAPFGWGEQAVVGTIGGDVACCNWYQVGTPSGFPTYYGRVFSGEVRTLRASVVPAFRKQGVNTMLKHRLLMQLFGAGVTRVYVECYRNNTPSLRTLVKTGFMPIGVITVAEIPVAGRFIQWAPATVLTAEFEWMESVLGGPAACLRPKEAVPA
jgi:RimJ/RimL family protein N-acetyltransferase